MMELRELMVREMAEDMGLELERSIETADTDGYMITDPQFHTIVVGNGYDLTLEDAANWLMDLKNTQRLLKKHRI